MKRVLMVAYHFPPLAGSSGIQRTLSFSKYLPRYGWEPIVLTVHPRAYERRSDDLLDQVDDHVKVVRVQAWDSSRHFAIGGKYPGFLGRPDRWISWWPNAVATGLNLIRQLGPEVIWSTFPIATAHLIGATLSKRSTVPWVADFRDPMYQDGYPSDPTLRSCLEQHERRTMELSSLNVFTTPGTLDCYRRRYPPMASRMRLLENGYDEDLFDAIEPFGLPGDELLLLHSGIVYPSERDPTQLFKALSTLRQTNIDVFSRLRVRFRAAVHEDLLHHLARQFDVESSIEIAPALPYRAALREMAHATALLVLQASNCNQQIPAKLYEYLRVGKPIVALTDPQGDTATTLMSAGVDTVAPLDDASAIARLILKLAHAPETFPLPLETVVRGASRELRTRELAEMFNSLCFRPA